MGTGVSGTFVIEWTQTWTDGVRGAAEDEMYVGASWRWSGRAIRMDGPDGIVRLSGGEGVAEIHRRAAAKARKLCGHVTWPRPPDEIGIEADQLLDRGFVLTDGRRAFAASRIETVAGDGGLVAFLGDLPPADTELWVARITTTARAEARARRVLTPCGSGLAAGTPIATPMGRRRIEDLQPGETIWTRDDGAQPVTWIGARRVSGARLHMEPHLRPIRVAAGTLGAWRPDTDLLLSPDYRLLITGRIARALFSEREVLVRAADLVALPGISVDLDVSEVTYVQVMLERHQIVTVAGLPGESYRPEAALRPPASVPLGATIATDPARLGPPVRRQLARGEAAILAARMG